MRISDCSSDGCSSDLCHGEHAKLPVSSGGAGSDPVSADRSSFGGTRTCAGTHVHAAKSVGGEAGPLHSKCHGGGRSRSEEHTSQLQSLMRISYAVFCLKKKQT